MECSALLLFEQSFAPLPYLCFSGVALTAGNADFIEQPMQLVNDGRDLGGEIVGVHPRS